MLIFVSDLHLTDDRRRASIDTHALITAIEQCIRESSLLPSERITLVLLGDIFEMLKSDLWMSTTARPWDGAGAALAEATTKIFRRIVDENEPFFEGLRRLVRDFGLSLLYLPGNHDGLLATASGAEARRAFRDLLPIQGEADAPFDTELVDIEHGVAAEHGHAFDEFNRINPANGHFVAGDAVVIEIVAQMPLRTAGNLGLAPLDGQYDPQLAFLHEMDNVRPQDPTGLLAWIERHLESLTGASHTRLEDALMGALGDCTSSFITSATKHGLLPGLLEPLKRPLHWSLSHASFRLVNAARRLPRPLGDEIHSVEMRMSAIGPLQRAGGPAIDLFVAGHTHLPLRHTTVVAPGRRITYVNTGTWRRVHLAVFSNAHPTQFDSFFEETLLCVHHRDARDGVRYEFRRQTRGL